MRIGNNPNRAMEAKNLQGIVLLAITHLPNLAGYHKDRLEIVQACLTTMRKNAGDLPVSVAVWDNGSCDLFRDWLRNEYLPDVLIETDGIGKISTRAMFARMLAPGTILAVTDDDMLFQPDWLRPQIELLNTFPNAACVTGYPVRTQFRWGVKNTLEWAAKSGILTPGRFIPDQWEDDFCDSIGRDRVAHRENTADEIDYMAEFDGKRAFLTSHHCQFICVPSRTPTAFEFSDLAMGDEKPFDTTMDTYGLRLCTPDRLVRHMGNVIDPALRDAVAAALAGERDEINSLSYWAAPTPKESVITFG